VDVTGSAAGSEVQMPSESELFARRLEKRERLLELGDAYPATLARTHDAAAAVAAFEQAEAEGREETAEPLTVAGRVTALRGRGFQNARLRRRAPFDLVLANILARPLVRLAPAIARHLAPGGRVVLSGLLVEQGQAVLDAYRRHGLARAERIVLDEWLTLVLTGAG